METKLFEVRDRATTIPVLAMRLSPATDTEPWLLNRAGYGKHPENYILLCPLQGGQITYDAFRWQDRTMHQAHLFIQDYFSDLVSGEVIDVEYILKETATPKSSERWEEGANSGTI